LACDTGFAVHPPTLDNVVIEFVGFFLSNERCHMG